MGCHRGLAATYVQRRALLSPACYWFLSTHSCTRSLSSWPGWMAIKISTEQVRSLNCVVGWPEWNHESLVLLGPEAFVMFIFSFLPISIFLFFSLGTFEKSVSVIWWKESESRSVMSDSLWPHGLCSPWNSPGQNTRVGSLSLLQGIFPTQGSNPGLLHCRRILYQLSHQRTLVW